MTLHYFLSFVRFVFSPSFPSPVLTSIYTNSLNRLLDIFPSPAYLRYVMRILNSLNPLSSLGTELSSYKYKQTYCFHFLKTSSLLTCLVYSILNIFLWGHISVASSLHHCPAFFTYRRFDYIVLFKATSLPLLPLPVPVFGNHSLKLIG